MRVKKVNIFKDIKLENFNSIETFFFDLKNSIFLLCPNVARFFKNSFIYEDETLKKNNIERKRISRLLGRENEENVARTRNCCGGPSSPRRCFPCLSGCLFVFNNRLNG